MGKSVSSCARPGFYDLTSQIQMTLNTTHDLCFRALSRLDLVLLAVCVPRATLGGGGQGQHGAGSGQYVRGRGEGAGGRAASKQGGSASLLTRLDLTTPDVTSLNLPSSVF